MPYYNAHNYVTTYLFDNVVLDLDSVLPVTCSDVVTLNARVSGDLTGHTFEWSQLSGTPVTWPESVNQVNVMFQQPATRDDKIFRFTIDTSGAIAASDKRLDVMFATHYWSIGNVFRTANSACPVVTIASNGEDNAVMFGNEIAGTEAFDIRCKGIVFELGATAKLGGVDAVVKFNSTDPVPGEIAIDAETLTAVFNNADVGKTVEINCTRVWDM